MEFYRIVEVASTEILRQVYVLIAILVAFNVKTLVLQLNVLSVSMYKKIRLLKEKILFNLIIHDLFLIKLLINKKINL